MTIQTIFNAALDIADPSARTAFLDKECVGDPTLRHRVEALLNAHFRDENFLEAGPAQQPTVAASTVEYTPPPSVPAVIAGRYKIREKLGEGGMGTVYVVETIKDVKTFFALKLIKPGVNSRQVLARFAQERQALAMMNHPNIAKFIDAGITETGQPFFVMELIKGMPITKFCDHEKLTVEERLNLFKPICKAVQHAHQKGIIHRDLKPGNILVAIYDGVPVPKVIDFGVAKATLQPLTDQSIYSEIGSMIGTLEYMAPEQAEVNSLDIDTRADLYSLGVILYELMTGTVPFSREELSAAAMIHLLELLKKEEPQKPSTKISGSGSLPSVAASRKIDPAALTKKLKGELDWIVMKCLEKERGHRYEGPNQLAQDIENYLADLPLIAGPPSTMYRMKKFLKRHKGKVLAAAVLLLSLIGGIIGTTWGMMKAVRAENLAATEAAIANATRDFVENDILQQVDPSVQANAGYLIDKDIKLKTLLDRAAEKATKGALQNEPVVLSSIELTIGRAYMALGIYDQAKPHLERSYELRNTHLGRTDSRTLAARFWLNRLLNQQTKFQEAVISLPELIKDVKQFDPSNQELLADCQYVLASSLENVSKYHEAQAKYREVYDYRKTALGENHHLTLFALRGIAGCHRLMGENKEAEKLFLEVIDRQRRFLGNEHPALLVSLNNLGSFYVMKTEEFDKADLIYDDLVKSAKRVYPIEHPVFRLFLNNQAATKVKRGNLQDAVKTFQELYDVTVKTLGEDNDFPLTVLYNIAATSYVAKDLVKAETNYLGVMKRSEKKYGVSDTKTIKIYRSLSRIKEDQNDYVTADLYLMKTLDGLRQQAAQSPLGLFIEINNVVAMKIKLKRTEAAKQLLAEAAGYENAPNLQIYNRATYHRLLSEVELLQGRVEPAKAELKQAVALIKQDPQSTQKGTFAAEERAAIRAALKTFLEKHAPGDKQLEALLSELQ